MINSGLQTKELQEVAFIKLGGTPGMVKEDGKLIGSGDLDDDQLYKLEESLGYYKKVKKDFTSLEFKLAKLIEKYIVENNREPQNITEYLHWVPSINKYVSGKVFSL